MPVFIDQTGRKVSLPASPQRIISLVPSQTELLSALYLNEQVIGITKFCIHPKEWFNTKKRIGGTKVIDFAAIHHLQPDLIIANKEENVKEQVEELEKFYPVWVSDVNNLPEAIDMIEQIGQITGRAEKAKNISQQVEENFNHWNEKRKKENHPLLKAIYLIWQKPYMTVGGDTFIHAMMQAAGFQNMYADKKRYPEISLSEIKAAKPDVLLLSSEPFPFTKKHIAELQPLLPATKIIIADGEMFSWYGSRLLQSPDYFASLQQQVK